MPDQTALRGMPDTDLMLRVQWGSDRAFAELYQRYYRRLLDFFYGMGRDAHAAEDLCHETFLRLWQLRVRYTVSGSFTAYLFSVARRIWLERGRQERKQWRLGVAQRLDAPGAAILASTDPGPGDRAYGSELAERIGAAVQELPEEQRMAFVLRTVEGMSLSDIASVMRCPVNTVRSRRLLAIKRLREALRGLRVR